MAVDPGLTGLTLLFARTLYGGLLLGRSLNLVRPAAAGSSNERTSTSTTGRRFAVVGMAGILGVGGLGVGLGIYPSVAGVLAAVALAIGTATLDDVPLVAGERGTRDPAAFVSNAELAIGSIAFAVLGQHSWPYAVNLGL